MLLILSTVMYIRDWWEKMRWDFWGVLITNDWRIVLRETFSGWTRAGRSSQLDSEVVNAYFFYISGVSGLNLLSLLRSASANSCECFLSLMPLLSVHSSSSMKPG